MTMDGIFKMVKAALMAVTVGVSATLAAMPTSQEIAAAEPLVQEVMKAEMDALRSGKKTREQVEDAAVALGKGGPVRECYEELRPYHGV